MISATSRDVLLVIDGQDPILNVRILLSTLFFLLADVVSLSFSSLANVSVQREKKIHRYYSDAHL